MNGIRNGTQYTFIMHKLLQLPENRTRFALIETRIACEEKHLGFL